MKVLITGGAGFIGANLVRTIRTRAPGFELVVLDDLSLGDKGNLREFDVDFREGSVLNLDLLTKATRNVDCIVHLAAIGSVPRSIERPLDSHNANATGTLAVLEAARANSVAHVIVASSSSVYGSNPSFLRTETDWTRPMSPYGVTKLATEAYALAYQQSYGLDTLAFRFFNVFGPLQRANHPYAAVIPRFIHSAMCEGKVTIFGDGSQTRDFTYVETVCDTLLDAICRRFTRDGPINLALGSETSLLELVSALEKELGKVLEVDFGAPRVGDVQHSRANALDFLKEFSSIVPVSLGEGLRKTIEWNREPQEQK